MYKATREHAVKKIESGGSFLYDHKFITRVEDLPFPEVMDDSPETRGAEIKKAEDGIKAYQERLAQLAADSDAEVGINGLAGVLGKPKK